MAKRKRKTSGRSTASRRKNRTQDRMPAGLITLFAGLVLMALAFVPGSSPWRTMHDVLFGVFGCGSFVLGAALCYLAILYTRGEDLLPHIAKLALGLIFASGTVIVFSDIPTDQTAAQMTAACYHNGMSAWLSGGALGAVLGGTLLLLCGRPAANLVMAALAACASGFLAGVELARRLKGQAPLNFPQETAIGALSLYVSNESVGVFQPMNINFGIIPPLDHRVKGKRNKNAELSARSLQIIDQMREEVLS